MEKTKNLLSQKQTDRLTPLIFHRGGLFFVFWLGLFGDEMARKWPTLEERFWSKVQKLDDDVCWMWKGARRGKVYGSFRIKGKVTEAHRAAWQLFRGPIPSGLCVCHHCDTPCCVNPAHLFLGTRSDNVKDSIRKGRWNRPKGEKCSAHKVSVEEVKQIRKLGLTQVVLAKRFGIGQSQISNIKTGHSWNWLK